MPFSAKIIIIKRGGILPNKENSSKLNIVISMLIFGTVGVFRNYIPLPSALIALARGLIGAVFLLLLRLATGKKPDFSAVRKNLWFLLLSGAALGINWVLLFEAYNYTSVASATLYYYLAPTIVTLLAPLFFKEKLTLKGVVCAAVALVGMVPVSGIFADGLGNNGSIKGLAFGLGTAFFYAAVVLLNKKIFGISAMDKTIAQLLVSAVVLLPYVLLNTGKVGVITPKSIALLITMGIIHTGVAYALYFGSIKNLKASTSAMLSYIDPVFAIILSSSLALEFPDIPVIIGAALILGAALVSQLPSKKN